MPETSLIRPTDTQARSLARALLSAARFAALGVFAEKLGGAMVTRIAMGTTPEGFPLSLISNLSLHTSALRDTPACSLLVGEPQEKGDPLAHPRLTIQCHARTIVRSSSDHPRLRAHYLMTHPKAKLYIDFADFNLVVFDVRSAFLNGGFGKAFHLMPDDLL